MIQGKVAIVTGSTSGIGLAVARRLAEGGAGIVLNGFRQAGDVEPLCASMSSEFGVPVLYKRADMSNADEIAAMVADTERELGAVDILVNNAGVQHVAPIDEFPVVQWEQILAINLSSNFHTIRAALPGMKAREWGRIVNIASAHGLVASPFKSAYVAAKHGVLGLTKTVALEVAETPITCNAICPGYVRTPLVDGQIRDQAKAHNMSEDRVVREVILATQPNRRFAEADAIGDTVRFLCSSAADSITGIALPVDGGWTAR
ncbi:MULTISPECIES: 3-hydroxybutyrate dehydrogenase [Burkholderia]|uniref:3-hydroxybutyrate dehydrogenase n=1 Tax=Burkholderia TaxID=32008 RepID=UPI0009E3CD86|nr:MULTISPECIES: 3-hydroxybutyrate dehydrogenase [Burkholderia]MEB2543752.1 3-hydroxybutyrate dehydrogenase [Burkholderia cenocepacia]TGN99192.1 3-hydroxybutyrate dehydrogenase [Burkholderia sp. USMB20]